ncbi:MAG: Hsp20/alpha crystallin family protein [Polyangiaceae bacterium]|jgi:HSP20 family molecular chaperone IbpA
MSEAVRVHDSNGSVAPRSPQQRRTVAPPVDVFENGDEILVVADVPGVSGESIDVRVENGTLTIETKRARAEARALAREYDEFDYVRSFRIPGGVDNAAITAETKEGTLVLRLPKAAASKPRKIAVRTAS